MGHRAKKHLGQNFLTSQRVIADAVAAGEVSSGDSVLEIGPGKGALTRELLQSGARVIVIEKDPELVALLNETFADEVKNKRLLVRKADILAFSPKDAGLSEGKYKLVANIPYYITGEILELFLEKLPQPSVLVVIVQKEVAQRVIARDGKESILSISVKAFGTPRIARTISRGSFSPSPDVDSALLVIENISRDNFKNIDTNRFFKILKAGFAHKRKVLTSNLSHLIPKETLEAFLHEHGLTMSARAEELSLADWLSLTRC